MKQILAVVSFVTLMATVAVANPVSTDRASQAASCLLGAKVQSSPLPASLTAMRLYVADGRFAIISADDCVRPVLAYGDRWVDDTAKLPTSVLEWLQAYNDEIEARIASKSVASAVTMSEWQRLSQHSDSDPLYAVAVSPMLTTTWNQSPRYNNLCPSGCVTGCVATATAQIMKYWNHPVQGTGSHSYYDGSHGMLSANFGNTTYQWSLMPNYLSGGSSSSQINAVATLMFHVGVAVEMTYGSSSSAVSGSYGDPAAVCAENALKTYFGYSHSSYHLQKEAMSDSLWCALIDAELAAGRPILYSGRDYDGGHAFVLDGSNNAGLYHFNWGWGGYCDGYYIMGQLNPAPGGAGGSASSTYNMSNTVVMGIRPASATMPSSCPVQITLTDPAHAYVTGAGNHAPLDTVTLRVNTSDGYRFARWSDGMVSNPRRQVLDSALSLTAIVEPINSTDTVYYSGNVHRTSYGGQGAFLWGMKLLPADLRRFGTLDAVQFYNSAAGTYNVRIYIGGSNAPLNLVHSQSVDMNGTDSWETIVLDNPVTVDTNLPLWVTLYNYDAAYPATTTNYCGNGNGSWCSFGGSWHILDANYTFMVRAILSEAEKRTVTASAEHGTVTGGGVHNLGSTVILTVQPDPCYAFSAWNDGNTDNPRFLTLTEDLTLEAICVRDTLMGEEVAQASGSYTWNGSTYTESGDYTYACTTAQGCDSVAVLHLTITNAIEAAEASELSVYPNPARDVLYVDGVLSATEAVVYASDGRVVLRFTVISDHQAIDLAPLQAGSYLLALGERTLRFVKH